MKKLISKLSRAVQVILAAPVKLPAKAANIIKYLALALGIAETIVESDGEEQQQGEEVSDEME